MTAASVNAKANNALASVDVYARSTAGCVFPDQLETNLPLLRSKIKIAAPVPFKQVTVSMKSLDY
jgi:hypothetical protein